MLSVPRFTSISRHYSFGKTIIFLVLYEVTTLLVTSSQNPCRLGQYLMSVEAKNKHQIFQIGNVKVSVSEAKNDRLTK